MNVNDMPSVTDHSDLCLRNVAVERLVVAVVVIVSQR